MIYKLAHFVKDKFGFIWDIVEHANSSLFAISHKKELRKVSSVLLSYTGEYVFRPTTSDDAEALELFFAAQPEEAFTFFKPHQFGRKSIEKVIRNKAFLTFVTTKDNEIVGYFFLRCFVNGKCFRGKMVDTKWRGKGIAKQMGLITTEIARILGMRMFGTIAPDNYASMESSKASNEVKIHTTLDNGYYYIEYLPKVL